MQLRDSRQTSVNIDRAFTVTLTLNVEDATALWTAAAEKALQTAGTSHADLVDTIGPREDPAIAECIAMLTAPASIDGCVLDDFTVTEDPAGAIERTQAPRLALMPVAHG